MSDQEQLIEGGQGRSSQELVDSSRIIMYVGTGAILLMIIVIIASVLM